MKKYITLLISFLLVLLFAAPTIATASPSDDEQRVKVLLQELEETAPNGQMPEYMTNQDIDFLLKKEPEKTNALLGVIIENAEPIENTLTKEEIEAQPEDIKGKRFSYSYNLDTNKETYVDGKAFYADSDSKSGRIDAIQPNDTHTVNNSTVIAPMAYPNDWEELNPQNYNDTRSTAKILITRSGNSYVGSAFRIGSRYFGTAGHCLYKDGSWASSVVVIPSYRSGNPQQPYGSFTATNYEVGGYWLSESRTADDWGVITINGTPNIGYVGFLQMPNDASFNGWWVRNQGYPASKANMYLTGGNVYSANTTTRLFSNSGQALGGMSGGLCMDERKYGIGIIVAQYTSNLQAIILRFDSWMFNKIASYPR